MSDDTNLKPSTLEEVSGSLLVQSALTLAAASASVPLAALLPVLTSASASRRQQQRVQAALLHVTQVLQSQEERLRNLSDEQYKLINETIVAMLSTTDQRKLEYLQRAVRHGLEIEDLVPQEAAVLSRVLRDISAEEVAFLERAAGYDRVQIASETLKEGKVFTIAPDAPEALIATGLIALGLLMPGEPTWDDSDLYRFSPIVPKLRALLADDTTIQAPTP